MRNKDHDPKKKKRILFICRRSDYTFGNHPYLKTTGLRLSAGFCVSVLNDNGYEAKMVIVNDNNDIDREVASFKPDYCIIEALWVVPSKFDVLTKLHPDITWIIRIHSEMPFIANEGFAIEWIKEYLTFPQILVAANSTRLFHILKQIVPPQDKKQVIYLPNCYVFPTFDKVPVVKNDFELNISCFGAVRPLKNQLQQASAAIEFADKENKALRFHINFDRVEMSGNSVLNNLIALFKDHPRHTLVQWQWMDHENMLKLLQTMDIGMQVSYTESFNHMAADYVAVGLPTVVSPEVRWMPNLCMADPNDQEDIVKRLHFVWYWSWLVKRMATRDLNDWADEASKVWIKYFKGK